MTLNQSQRFFNYVGTEPTLPGRTVESFKCLAQGHKTEQK